MCSLNPGCEIHTFDHTVEPGNEPAFVKHHKIGINPGTSKVDKAGDDVILMRLSDVAQMLGHTNRWIHSPESTAG